MASQSAYGRTTPVTIVESDFQFISPPNLQVEAASNTKTYERIWSVVLTSPVSKVTNMRITNYLGEDKGNLEIISAEAVDKNGNSFSPPIFLTPATDDPDPIPSNPFTQPTKVGRLFVTGVDTAYIYYLDTSVFNRYGVNNGFFNTH